MKKIKIILFIIILLLCFIVVSIIANQNKNIKKEPIIIKEMSESIQVSNLQTQINTLNASHDEYAKNVQAYKEKIAEAITNQGVPTSADAKAEVIAENIGKILQAKTTATATATQILKGQTAWVNGSKITGTMVDRGTLNWNPTTSTTYNVPEGYYSGGTLNSSGAYNAGFSSGVTAADNRADANSVNYQTGYNNGYNAGYNAGVANASYGPYSDSISFGYRDYAARLYSFDLPNLGWTTIRVWGNIQYTWINGTRYGNDVTVNISNSKTISIEIQGLGNYDVPTINYSLN